MKEEAKNRMYEAARAHREARKAQGLSVRLSPFEKVERHPNSLRFRIDAKCYDCQGCDDDPAWQWRVGNCTDENCPLYPVRPHQRLHGRPMPEILKM